MARKSKAWHVLLLEQVSGLGLKIGLPCLVVTLTYLLVVFFGDNIQKLASMTPTDRTYFVNSLMTVMSVLTVATVAVTLSLIIRFFFEELTGQLLALAGAALNFALPFFLVSHMGPEVIKANGLLAMIIYEMRDVGLIALVPGLVLLVRDAVLRIWRGISNRLDDAGKPTPAYRLAPGRKYYSRCCDMEFCREYVRKVCPAYKAHKSCWRIKSGCYCDENTMLRAMMEAGSNSEYMDKFMESLGIDEKAQPTDRSSRVYKERCKRCCIYAEHQRQKYRILSPIVFPLLAVLAYIYYNSISVAMFNVLVRADRFVSFLTHHPGQATSASPGDWTVMTILGTVWLVVVLGSYIIQILEYLIFKLQV